MRLSCYSKAAVVLAAAAATGTLTVSAEGGVARFGTVRVDRIGLDYRLTAAFAGATPAQTSNAFAVIP